MDDTGFEGFCRDEWPRLVRALAYLTGDVGVAEDLAQEALARAYQRWSTVRTLDSPGGWVHRVGLNLARSRWRRVVVARRVERQLVAAGLAEPEVASGDPDDPVWQAVLALPLDQRQAVVLRYVLDFDAAAAASIAGTTPEAIRTRALRGRTALRVALDRAEDER